MKKREYLSPEAELFEVPCGLQLLVSLSLDGDVLDFEGDEIEGF